MTLRRSITKRWEIPGEPGEWLMLRMLGGFEMEEARTVKQSQSLGNMKQLGREIVQMAQEEAAREDVDRDRDLADQYDEWTVVRASVVEWSYTEDDGKPVPVTDENLRELLSPRALKELFPNLISWNFAPAPEEAKKDAAPSSSS